MRREHTDAVNSIAVSPEGTLFASASWDSSLRIWPTGLLTSSAVDSARLASLPRCHTGHDDLSSNAFPLAQSCHRPLHLLLKT